jgi:chaperonin cofactor prefoldin
VRTSDILSSIEYRELEKKNRALQTKVDNLKRALKKAHQDQKKFHETHMCK